MTTSNTVGKDTTKDKKLPTIKLQGKEYVQVKDRILFFNETYGNGCITTEAVELLGGMSVKATVTPDVDKPQRIFTGRSYGVIDDDKALEKLETVAVGRALAFMGIGVIESVASAEEMEKFYKSKRSETRPQVIGTESAYSCEVCGSGVDDAVVKYSSKRYGKILCRTCQQKQS